MIWDGSRPTGDGAIRNVQSVQSMLRPFNPIHVVQRSTVQSFNERAELPRFGILEMSNGGDGQFLL